MNKQKFFEEMAAQGLALTFDDVLMKTDYSECGPNEVSLASRFSRRVPLNVPIVSAAMDTVTEYEMAIAMAMLGGIGVIHKGMPPEEQARQVARVKFSLNSFIERPISVRPSDTIAAIKQRRMGKPYSFQSFPVLDDENLLLGLITGKDFKFCEDELQTAELVMTKTKNVVTALPETSMHEAYKIMQKNQCGVLPLLDSDNRLIGMFVHSDAKRIVTRSSDDFNVDSNGNLRVAAAVGVGEDARLRAEMLAAEGIDAIVIDTAHAHTAEMIRTIADLSTMNVLQDIDIVVGNVSQPKAVQKLAPVAAHRIDGIKIGQGPGSICTTRKVTGAGRPQLTAVYECAVVAEKYGIPVIADGGIRMSGDVTTAIAAGAHCVMLGGVLAGTAECPGDVVLDKGLHKKVYRGMGSLGVMEASRGAAERYRQGDVGAGKLVPEGIEGYVPFKGSVADVLHQFVGGLRAGMGYAGAADIPSLQQKAEFERITGAGDRESHPHDVEIAHDAPNYQRR